MNTENNIEYTITATRDGLNRNTRKDRKFWYKVWRYSYCMDSLSSCFSCRNWSEILFNRSPSCLRIRLRSFVVFLNQGVRILRLPHTRWQSPFGRGFSLYRWAAKLKVFTSRTWSLLVWYYNRIWKIPPTCLAGINWAWMYRSSIPSVSTIRLNLAGFRFLSHRLPWNIHTDQT